ncbi:la protein 1-like [Ananas comosus]|uniref:La protein 1-like n=1 Tax=Ananas comosus TaxID=4615 RepID=A0A6P5GRD7_ANACO|nr:la protein 1-like [Ananas comosus]
MATVSLDESKAKNVLRQVEFYFSDSNLPRDNFLKKTVEESEDELVSLAVICSFSRMKTHLGLNAATKPDEVPEEMVLAVAEVLRKSSSLRVSEDGKRVGRSSELKLDEVIEQVDSRTIAAAPLPYDVKLEDVESFFAKLAKVNSVRLPRHVSDKRHFCGSALIEFSEEEDAKKVLMEKLSFAGAELEIKPKKDFDAEREKKRAEFEKTRSNKNSPHGSDSYPKGLIINFKVKSKSVDDMKGQSAEEKVNDNEEGPKDKAGEEKIPEGVDNNEKSSPDVEGDNEGKATEEAAQDRENNVAKGSTEESGDGKDVVTREDLKAIFEKFGTVKYVDFKIGEDSGYIRFDDPKAAVDARAFAVLENEGGLLVKNHIVTLEALTGDEEREYWNLLRGNQEKRYKENRSYRGRGGKNARGGRHFDGKRGRQADSAEKRPNKAQKVDVNA